MRDEATAPVLDAVPASQEYEVGILRKLFTFSMQAINPPLAIAICFLAVQLTLTITYSAKHSIRDSSILLPFCAMLILVLADIGRKIFWYTNGRRQALWHSVVDSSRFVQDWIPAVILIYSYENLRNLTSLFVHGNITPHLIKFDQQVFGIQPSVLLERISNPILTDYFAITYSLYFVFPFLIVVSLYIQGRLEAYFDVVSGVVLCLYIGFVGYVVFPASPPRFSIPELYTVQHLQGWFYSMSQGVYDRMAAAANLCAFPSLHVALSTTALLYSYRYATVWKKPYLLFFILAPLVVSLWVATVYLRHHWFGDILAGWLLAVFCYSISLRLTRLWYRPILKRLR